MPSLTCRFSAQRLPLVSHSQICVQSLGGTFHVDTLDVFRVECIHVYFMAQRLTVDETMLSTDSTVSRYPGITRDSKCKGSL